MRKGMIIAVLLNWAFWAQSQVLTQLQLPPLGLTLKSQLWNLSLVNTSPGPFNIKIEMTMSESVTGTAIMKGVSSTVVLPTGAKLFSVNSLSPITYTILGGGYGLTNSPEGFLPVGVFEVCYQIIKINNDAPEVISEECETVEVEPISPPQLVLPQDSEWVDLSRPFFTWIPPTPMDAFGSLSFDWVLVEVMPTQTAAEAIQNNAPVLTQQSIIGSHLQYPLSSPALDTGKIYAWRVVAKNSASPIANSEIWTFRLRPSWIDSTEHPSVPVFAKLRAVEDASLVRCAGLLRFQLRNESSRQEATFVMYDLTGGTRKAITLDISTIPLVFGDNYLTLDLTSESSIKNGHLYLMEIAYGSAEKGYLKFEYRRTN